MNDLSMEVVDQWIARFGKLDLRERMLALLAVAILFYFVTDLALLSPQQKQLQKLQQQSAANKAELVSINKVLSSLGSADAPADPLAKDRAMLKDFRRQIAEVDAFLGRTDATASQVGALLHEMLDASSRLTLVSLKTLPVTTLYLPVAEDASRTGSGTAGNAASGGTGIQGAIYRHGVEISIKGDYLDLLPYLENLQRYPKRLFWHEARLDVTTFPDAVLVLVIYTVSEQASSPLG